MTLTVNSTALYLYENSPLVQYIGSLKCSENISQELGIINASKTLVGSIPISTTVKTTKTLLALYFMKTTIATPEGGRDLVTVLAIAHVAVSKMLVLLILKKITDKHTEFREDFNQSVAAGNKAHTHNIGEFKVIMTQIIKTEENFYDLNRHPYSNYGSTRDQNTETQMGLSQLVLAHEEVEEVRQLMLDNINKLLARGDKIGLLVDQTDRLTSSLLLFQRQAHVIKRRRWSKAQFIMASTLALILITYVVAGSLCGFPSFGNCRA